MWQFFAENGYTVIAFDGPGQGASLFKYHVYHTHNWEKPVGAVLDYFKETDVTLLGFSFGGYWCVRAVAYEKRVKRLIIHAAFYDLLEGAPAFTRKTVNWMMKHEKFLNFSIRLRMKLFPMIKVVCEQIPHINGRQEYDPVFIVNWMLQMNKEHLHSELVDQDVLLLGGEKDAFQPLKLFYKQKAALINARSLTARIFTKQEKGENHCQIGNPGLPLSVMLEWLQKIV